MEGVGDMCLYIPRFKNTCIYVVEYFKQREFVIAQRVVFFIEGNIYERIGVVYYVFRFCYGLTFEIQEICVIC